MCWVEDRKRKREGGLDEEIWKCRKKTIMLYVSLSVLTSFFPSSSLVLLVFIVITTAAPLESSTFFSTGAINEEGLTPFSSYLSFLIPFSGPHSSPFSPPGSFLLNYFPTPLLYSNLQSLSSIFVLFTSVFLWMCSSSLFCHIFIFQQVFFSCITVSSVLLSCHLFSLHIMIFP